MALFEPRLVGEAMRNLWATYTATVPETIQGRAWRKALLAQMKTEELRQHQAETGCNVGQHVAGCYCGVIMARYDLG